jgi:hypothetical protein
MFRPTIKPKKVLLALYSVEVYTAHLKPVILLCPVLGNETFSTYLRAGDQIEYFLQAAEQTYTLGSMLLVKLQAVSHSRSMHAKRPMHV